MAYYHFTIRRTLTPCLMNHTPIRPTHLLRFHIPFEIFFFILVLFCSVVKSSEKHSRKKFILFCFHFVYDFLIFIEYSIIFYSFFVHHLMRFFSILVSWLRIFFLDSNQTRKNKIMKNKTLMHKKRGEKDKQKR